ncbi:MAG: hypothetical protein HOP10_11885 [Chitinophagaceae bacterium]|nr:hypothetical protein [Chitinophagaceae bacterium]
MTKQIAFILIIVLRIAYQPSHDQKNEHPFTGPSPLPTSTIPAEPVEVIRTNANDRLIRKWIIGDNRPGLCYNSFNVPCFMKEGAANRVLFASKERSILLIKNKS